MMELLSPAGDRDALIAAVRNGADAVYLGAQALNARRGAGNFDADGLTWAADHCHERGVRLFVTVNIIVKQQELAVLADIACQLAHAGVDAAIVQDLGAATALREMAPGLEIHASTQMAVHNRYGVQFCRDMGLDRVVLAREMRDEEIAACADVGPELEVFAHGALCVSCSGQCLFSSLVGGRSGNRGLCAQPCRLPYKLDDAEGYLLSPKDLCQLGRLRQLESLGVRAIKIEGRLKRPEYVAIVTRMYREMLDRPHEVTARETDLLRQIFNRGGFTAGYGPGLVDSELMHPEKPNHCGVAVGLVADDGKVRLLADISSRDQLVIGDEPVKLSGAAGETVRVGGVFSKHAKLIRLADDTQLRRARASFEGVEPPRVHITGKLSLRVGAPMRLRVTDGRVAAEASGGVVAPAEKRGADRERLQAQLKKTGGTVYAFEGIEMDVDAEAFVQLSVLNELRRDALVALTKARIAAARRVGEFVPPAVVQPTNTRHRMGGPRACPMLRIQSPNIALLHDAAKWIRPGVSFELVYAPDNISEPGLDAITDASGLILALPMVSSDEALDSLLRWTERHADALTGVIASNPAHLALKWPVRWDADFALNAANEFTVAELRKLGARLYVPSVELTAREIEQLPGDKELIVYGRLPLMQLRHCPLNARRTGMPHTACHTCDQTGGIDHARLIDRKGVAFPLRRLKTPSGCIVRVLNSVPMSLIKQAQKLPEAAAWRIILTDESSELSEAIVKAYARVAQGGDARETENWPWVEAIQSTTGHYFRGVE